MIDSNKKEPGEHKERHFYVHGDEGYYLARYDRARARLDDGRSPEKCWFFGIAQFEPLDDDIEIANPDGSEEVVFRIQSVVDPPDFVEILRATGNTKSFTVALTWAPYLTHEFVVRVRSDPVDHTKHFEEVAKMAVAVATLLRARTQAQFLVPVASNFSWSVIAAAPEGKCQIEPIEHYPTARIVHTNRVGPTIEDFTWTIENLKKLFDMYSGNQRFSTAVEALAQHNLQSNDRMIAAMLWTGIEALLSPRNQGELSYRIALNGAALLEVRGSTRIAKAKRIKALYDTRSKVVHGAKIDNTKLSSHNIEARDLLADLIVAILDRGNVPEGEEFERLILGDEVN